MPYIKQERREEYDNLVDEIARRVYKLNCDDCTQFCGDVNYIITTLLEKTFKDNTCYSDCNEIVGILECAKLEFYRRKAAPYEDTKVELNGDVY